ncbi:sugar kinase [Streptomyces sp. URMC 123]|uniref:sugar kinase n=1 Tax=Streptomyces sp. URMC 123 TaxID=3423403 RepID=UPI003F1DD693
MSGADHPAERPADRQAERPVERPVEPPAEDGPPPPRTSLRRRWLTLLVVILLIGFPTCYLVLSAVQSRESGNDKQDKAAATGLTWDYPSKVQSRIYDVPIPPGSLDVAYYETNSWRTSKLYVQFMTNAYGLDLYLRTIGTSPSRLEPGRTTIDAEDAAAVGWRLGDGEHWSGTVHTKVKPQPEQEIMVDRSNPEHPMVYVVSEATP